jgi:hypothetical protein
MMIRALVRTEVVEFSVVQELSGESFVKMLPMKEVRLCRARPFTSAADLYAIYLHEEEELELSSESNGAPWIDELAS